MPGPWEWAAAFHVKRPSHIPLCLWEMPCTELILATDPDSSHGYWIELDLTLWLLVFPFGLKERFLKFEPFYPLSHMALCERPKQCTPKSQRIGQSSKQHIHPS